METSRWLKVGMLLMAVALAGCVNQQETRKREILEFMQKAIGEWQNDTGTLFIAPVYARMISLDTLYVERVTPRATTSRLIAVEPTPDAKKVVQFSYVFSEPNRWRDLRTHHELLTGLQPQDVRPAGTCDIKVAADNNSLTYSCAGSPPATYSRVVHTPEEE